VVSAVLPHFTTAPDAKPEPFTVRVNAAPPAVAEVGLSEEIAGAAIVKLDAEDVLPLALFTVTPTVAGLATRLEPTDAVSWPEFTKVVVSAVVPHITVAPEAKFEPLTANVKAALPLGVVLGFRLEIAGVGPAVTVNADWPDVAPPGLVTVTLAEP